MESKKLTLKKEYTNIDTSSYSVDRHKMLMKQKDFFKYISEYEAKYLFESLIETNFSYHLVKSESPDWIDIEKKIGIEATIGDRADRILELIQLLKQEKDVMAYHRIDMYGDIFENAEKKFRKLNKNYTVCDLNVLYMKMTQTDFNCSEKQTKRIFKELKRIRSNYDKKFDYFILYSIINYIFKEDEIENRFHMVYLFDFHNDCFETMELKEEHYMSLLQKAVLHYDEERENI